jgi:hypothetical protein
MDGARGMFHGFQHFGGVKGCAGVPGWDFKKLISDALPSPGVNPLEGSPKCSCGKLGLRRHSRLPAL